MSMTDCFSELMAYSLYFLKHIESIQPPYEETLNKFNQMITTSRELVETDKASYDDWHKSLFAVCAWLDEQILLSDWREKEAWQLNPLQKQYFQTTHAGEKFFDVLERFDPVNDRQIIEVYNFCIKFGFQGKHFKPVATKGQNLVESSATDTQSERLLLNYVDVTGRNQLFVNAYRSDLDPRADKKRFEIRMGAVLAITAAASVLGIFILGFIYNLLLNEPISGYLQ